MRMLVVIGLILACAAGAAVGDGAVAPKLEDIDRRVTPPPTTDEGDARPLPATVTICQDTATRRCWTESGSTACGLPESGAKVFRHAGSSRDPGAALEDCWRALDR